MWGIFFILPPNVVRRRRPRRLRHRCRRCSCFFSIIWLNIALVSRAAGPLAVHLYRVVAAAACGILLSSKPTLSYMQQTYFDK